MRFDQHYLRDEKWLIRAAIALGLVLGVLAVVLARALGPDARQVPPEQVWDYVHRVASGQGIDPEFVYALAWAESTLDPKAESSVARGMMQITKPTWRETTDRAYRHAWDWKTNIEVAVDYLAGCKAFLEEHGSFTYPLLAASYRYGPFYVKNRGFQIDRLRTPKNEIYRRIFEGNIRPVAPPDEE